MKKGKIFCIGYNKTGTTSLTQLMRNEGYKVAPQRPFELLLDYYTQGEMNDIVDVIKKDYDDCNFFQDIPFSLPDFFIHLDANFPNSKFILTYRDSDEHWYSSYIRFLKSLFGNIESPYNFTYIRKGWILEILVKVYGTNIGDPYNKKIMTDSYKKHIAKCEVYFKNNSNFIKINLSNESDFKRLETFLNKRFKATKFPHKNISAKIT